MILLPKRNGEYRGIGLVEVIWKIITTIINSRLRTAISLHDALHGFRKVSGLGTATVETKLAQQLSVICHEPLFQVFLNVKKAYDPLDRTRCMEILWGYGFWKNLWGILERFWEGQTVVARSGG